MDIKTVAVKATRLADELCVSNESAVQMVAAQDLIVLTAEQLQSVLYEMETFVQRGDWLPKQVTV